MKTCMICGRALNQEADPLSVDCGGDCWGCIGEIEAEMGDELAAEKVRAEFVLGIRPSPGKPKTAERRPLTEQDRDLFLSAWGKFGREGRSDVLCNRCGSLIEFRKQGSAVVHRCSCGKFNGALRAGLHRAPERASRDLAAKGRQT